VPGAEADPDVLEREARHPGLSRPTGAACAGRAGRPSGWAASAAARPPHDGVDRFHARTCNGLPEP